MIRARLKAAVAVASAAGLCALSACGSGTTEESAGSKTSPVVVGFTSDWQTMDHQVGAPNLMHWQTGGYDRLTAIVEGEVVPYVAKEWEVADDNTSITFTLRDDVTCHDGTTVTPEVVAKSFQRLFTVERAGANVAQNFGAGPWKVSADEAAGTVTIDVETPFRGLAIGAAAGESSIVCPEGLKDPKALETGFFGSGPYTLKSAKHADSVVLEKNDDWTWGPVVDGEQVTAADLPDTQTWKIISDQTAMANAMQTGDLDSARMSGPDVTRFEGNDDFSVERLQLNFPLTMTFQPGEGHSTSDVALRKALSSLVEPEKAAKAYITDGRPIDLATSFIDASSDCFDETTVDLYPEGGLDEATQVLEEAGYTGVGSALKGPDGKPVTVRIATTANLDGQAGSYLLEAFKPLGADVKLSNVDTATMNELVFGGQMDVGLSAGNGTVQDPSATIISYWGGNPVTEGGLNVYGPGPKQDPKWNELLDAGFATSDCEPWAEAQRHALEEAILLPIARGYWTRVSSADVKVSSGYYVAEPWNVRNVG